MKYTKLLITLPVLVFALFASSHSASAATTGILRPISDGLYTQWTPSSGTSHYSLVNETTCDGLTGYVSTNTTNQRDAYNLNISSIPDGATITNVSISPCASKINSGGSSTLKVFYRNETFQSADSGSYSLPNTPPSALSATNVSANFVKGPSTILQIGAIYSAGTKGARLSQIYSTVTYTPLATPSALSATALSTESARLNWTDNATNETGFKIERSTDNVNFAQIATSAANTNQYFDKNVIGTFYYRIRSYNSGGNSLYSNTASATVSLKAPVALSASGSTGSASLNWTDQSANEDGFKIERSTDNVNFSEINTVGANVNTYLDSPLSSGVYYYRVKAYKGVIDSSYTSTASATVL